MSIVVRAIAELLTLTALFAAIAYIIRRQGR